MRLDGDWKDLQTKGYVVLRDFLPKELIETAHAEANATKPGEAVDIWLASVGTSGQIEPHVRGAMKAIGEHTDIKLTELDGYAFYFNPNPMCKFVWHTDLPSFFMFQNHYDYVNFWMPVRKPDPTRTGMEFLPMDTLAKLSPRLYELCYRRGANMLVSKETAKLDGPDLFKWWLTSAGYFLREPAEVLIADVDGRIERVPLDFNISDYTVKPDVSPGDALVMRGDMLHNGQDLETDRLAVSVRAVNGDLISRKSDFLHRSPMTKCFFSAGNPVAEQVLAAYSYYGKDEIPAKDLLAFIQALLRGEQAQWAACNEIRPHLPEIFASL
jgi:hypothetical protein